MIPTQVLEIVIHIQAWGRVILNLIESFSTGQERRQFFRGIET